MDSLEGKRRFFQAREISRGAAVGRLEEFEQAGGFILSSRHDVTFNCLDRFDGELLFHVEWLISDQIGCDESK